MCLCIWQAQTWRMGCTGTRTGSSAICSPIRRQTWKTTWAGAGAVRCCWHIIPLLLDSYAGWGADLVLCGHVHGGLVRLPFLGGVLSPERKFFPKYDKGLYEKDGTKMYVSGGIGKPRLCNPPEINLIHLKSVQK